MALSIEQKQKLVEEVSSEAKVALSAAAAEYRGLSVDQLTKLRSNAKDLNVYLKVVKNTLAKRAIKDTDFECMQNGLKGPLILAFSRDNPGSAAKLFNDFAKESQELKPVLIALNGELVDIDNLSKIAKLPTKDEAISMLMGVMKMPIEKLVRTVAAPHTKLVQTLFAYSNSKASN